VGIMAGKEYFKAEDGVFIRYCGGKTTQETTLLKYWFDAGIKKIASPKYVGYRGKVNGQLLIDKNNKATAFFIYVKTDEYDIRFHFSYELMNLILSIRNSMYDSKPVRNPFYEVERSELNFSNLSFTPKLIEALSTKRIPLNDAERNQILSNNMKEILDLKDKHEINVSEFLKDEEGNSLQDEDGKMQKSLWGFEL
jgi:hypothetical protein